MTSKKKQQPTKTKNKREVELTDLEVKNTAAIKGGSSTTTGDKKPLLRGGWDGN